jgi:hypothetical protein
MLVGCMLTCSLMFTGCSQNSSNDSDISPSVNDAGAVSSFLMHNNGLVITLLTDDEDNETYYFEGFVFNFNSSGGVVATNGSDTINGSYDVFRDDGRVELYMDFPNIGNFEELDDDWYFISIDQNTIRFNDDGDRLEFRQR